MALLFSSVLPDAASELRYHPVTQRVRAALDGVPVADSSRAVLVWEPRRVVPTYAVPAEDLLVDARDGEEVVPDLAGLPPRMGPERFDIHTAPGRQVVLRVDGGDVARVAFRPHDPELMGAVVLDSTAFEWREEEDRMVGHPHDPFKRIDVLASSRRVEVSLDGTVLASSDRPMLLLETHLPERWYLPAEDVRMDLLVWSDTRTTCAYKGHASYLSYPPAGDVGRDLAWTYPDPLHDGMRVRDMVCFFAERTDTTVDGVRRDRPVTFWSARA